MFSFHLNQKGIAPIIVMLILFMGILTGLFLMRNPQIFSPQAAEPGQNTVDMRRLYNPKHNTWYWADNQSDINNLVAHGFQDAGTLFSAYINGNNPGTVPLHRLIKNNDYYYPGSELFLTTSKPEVELLLSHVPNSGESTSDNMLSNQPIEPVWQLKDSALYVYPPTGGPAGSVPVYRLIYNNPEDPKFDGDRYYVVAQEEIDALMGTGKYINEGIAFYGVGPTIEHSQPVPVAITPEFEDKTLAYCNDNNTSRIHLEWTPVPEATMYRIFRSTTEPGSGTKLQELQHYAYNDDAVKDNVDYAYYIEAVTPNGSLTGQTKILTAVSCQ